MIRHRRTLCFALIASLGFLGCASEDVLYSPRKQILPAHINKIAVRPIINKTQQFGLEDKFVLRIRDEFLRRGLYQIVPEKDADGLVLVTITRYILIPTQYDSVLTPTAYKLRVLIDLDFIDRTNNTILFREPNLEGIQTYSASTVSGGITEEEARELIWDVLSRDVVTRVVDGFGSVSGASRRSITGEAPPNQEKPALPSKPVNPDLY
jgi:hypothetical protein